MKAAGSSGDGSKRSHGFCVDDGVDQRPEASCQRLVGGQEGYF